MPYADPFQTLIGTWLLGISLPDDLHFQGSFVGALIIIINIMMNHNSFACLYLFYYS